MRVGRGLPGSGFPGVQAARALPGEERGRRERSGGSEQERFSPGQPPVWLLLWAPCPSQAPTLGTKWVFGVCERSVLWTRGREKGGVVAKLTFQPPFLSWVFLFFFSFFWRFLSQYNSMKKVCVYRGRGLGIQWGKRGKEADMYANVGCVCEGPSEGQSVCGMGRRQDSAGGGVCEAH